MAILIIIILIGLISIALENTRNKSKTRITIFDKYNKPFNHTYDSSDFNRDYTEYYYRKIKTYIRKGSLIKAHYLAQKILKGRPSDLGILSLLMQIRLQLRYWKLAEETANDLLRVRPGDKEALDVLRSLRDGSAQHQSGKADNNDSNGKSKVDQPTIIQGDYGLINKLLANNQQEKAHEAALALLSRLPNDEMGLRLLMRARLQLNYWKLAEEAAKDLLKIAPIDIEALRALRTIKDRSAPRQIEKPAIEASKAKIQRSEEEIIKDDLRIINNYLANDQPQKAHNAVLDLLRKYPNNEMGLRLLMRRKLQLHYWKLAEETANDLLKVSPGDKEALEALQSLRDQSSQREAEKSADQAKKLADQAARVATPSSPRPVKPPTVTHVKNRKTIHNPNQLKPTDNIHTIISYILSGDLIKSHNIICAMLESPNLSVHDNEILLRALMRISIQLRHWESSEDIANELLEITPGDNEALRVLQNPSALPDQYQAYELADLVSSLLTTSPSHSPEPPIVAHDSIDHPVETQHFNQEIDEDDLGFGDDHGHSSIKGFD